MNNKQQSKVRFVRCPKCTKILQEPDHVPLYTCGGCSTILQAKNYKGPLKNTALSSLEQDVHKKYGVIHDCDVGESSGLSQRSNCDHSIAQDKGINSDVDGNSRNTEQNGAASSFDNYSLSKESSFLRDQENGEINDIESNKNSISEHNRVVNSSENTGLSEESNSITNTENGEREDIKSEGNHSKAELYGSVNYAHQTALSEESNFVANKENRDRNIDQSDSEEQGTNDNPSSLKDEQQKLIKVNSTIEDDSDHDEKCNGVVIEKHHQKQIGDMNSGRKVITEAELIEEEEEDEEKLVRHAKSANEVSSLAESAAIENFAQHHFSDHELPEETRRMYIEEKQTREDRPENNQIGYVHSAADDTSWVESTDIVKPTHLVPEYPAEIDASDQQMSEGIEDVSRNNNSCDLDEPEVKNRGKEYGNGIDLTDDASSIASPRLMQFASSNPVKKDVINDLSKETSKMHLVEIDTLGNSIHHLAARAEVGTSGKETVNETDPKDITEQVGTVQVSSAPLLSTMQARVENDESVYVSTPSSATDLKTSYEMELTKVSRDPLQHQRNSFNNEKGTSEQNSKDVGKRAVNVDSELGTLVKQNPESSSKRSPVYDGSVSSFDGNDDKDAEQPQEVGRETLSPNNAVAGSDGTEGSPDWNSLPSEQIIFGNLRAQRPPRSSSTMASGDKLKSRVIEKEGPLEGHGIPRRFRPNRENFLPRVPYRRRSSEITYETGSTSSYALHEEAPRHQMLPHGRRFPEASLWREKEFLPPYYNSETSEEFYERPRHHSYMDRRRRTESWSKSGTLPRMPYSGEMFDGRYPYMHRYPEDRRWSAQLPPPATYFHHNGGYIHPGWETRWDPYDSYPTSPQRFMESESSYAWGHDTISLSDDQRHKDQVMRRMYLREKRQAVKTPFRPIAGGTPFITCSFCFHILQLPQNFLPSTRRRQRTNKLKCGACSRVLDFSLENEGGLTASETTLNRNVNLAMSSNSYVNHSRQSSLNSADGQVLLSCDSLGAPSREKRKLKPGASSNEERMEGLRDDDDAIPPRGRHPKVTWQLPARSKSPLHKLMGYSSPNQLLTFHEADGIE